EKFNQTQTIALLSLIAERIAAGDGDDFERFAHAHPELFDRGLLASWYDAGRLGSPLARRAFLMPQPHAAPAAAHAVPAPPGAGAAPPMREVGRAAGQAAPPRPRPRAARGPGASRPDRRPSGAAARCR